jgi:hypothetical protein
MVAPKLNSTSYKNARKMLESQAFEIKRSKTLLIRILTRIDKINVFLGTEDIGDKILKTKISLLSQLLGVAKTLKAEIKSLEGKTENSKDNLTDILG